MKKIILISVITFFLGMSFNAYSADSIYYGVNLGASTVEERGIDTGIIGSIFYGAAYDEFRLEGELFYQENDIDLGSDLETMGIRATTESHHTFNHLANDHNPRLELWSNLLVSS